ncbi:MAG: response regulator transcription factor [Eubacterium sp.]|nr:response regulator transcription factor [Eubacterium sp.]
MTTTLNVLIVEDDYNDLKHAKRIVEMNFPDVKVYDAGNRKEALNELAKHDMNLLLLDVRLPDGTGFDVARDIRNIPQYRFVHIVYITGEDYDPLETYNTYHCYSFISKPYTEDTMLEQLGPLLDELRQEKSENRVPVRREARAFSTTKGEIIIPVNDILYAELRFRNMVIHTRKGEYQTKRMSLKSFKEYINDPGFFICHESFIVNMRKVYMIEKGDKRSYVALFNNSDDKGCIVSQKRYKGMKELLDKKAAKMKAGGSK